MKNQPVSLFLILLVLLPTGIFYSCDSDRSGLKPSTGKTNEIVAVTNSETLWKGRVGSEISGFFGNYQEGLPQPEKIFDLAHVPESGFSQMFKTHHNIFILDINPKFLSPVIETREDFWAKPQRVIKMTVADEKTFFTEFELRKEAFMDLFNSNERRRAALAFGTIRDVNIQNQLKSTFDIDLMIPKSFMVAAIDDDFVWLRREAQNFSQGLLVYCYPYTDTLAFEPDQIINLRNHYTKAKVLGPLDGSFMKVSMVEPPIARRINFNDNFAVEMRGLWELEGDFMGGPFINYTLVDQRKNRVVTIDGYVYHPNKEKKDLLRQLEALIFTLSFPEDRLEGSASVR
ncbi:MAG: DUF4837 family protein [Sphingobacteriia bacterium]|nr:DUF4837 family protein [Sphingobacteriia bacterium]